MASITFQFSATPGLVSEAIKLFERGWASHVDAVLADGTLIGARSDAIGGKPRGVQARPPGYETWTQTQIVRLPATPAQETAFLNFLEAQIGKPYDKLAIVAFAADRDWRHEGEWFCSELQAAALTAAGWLPHTGLITFNEITPRDLLMITSPWSI